ncbi:hypothetical protein TNCV_159141 [Trichonephila clavipes]|uniref:Uncharacterized protein n=1 Tax=Trichonephila clavipes TaxID=2585209 RepID=A0A8X6UYB4_TRICX|nr:hypothetical protein TNCV_159141 [Trichonephila clavipes]
MIWAATLPSRNVLKLQDKLQNVTEAPFVDMLTLLLMLQFQDDTDNLTLQLDGAPPHWSANMRDYLDEHLSQSSIGQNTDYNMPLTSQ